MLAESSLGSTIFAWFIIICVVIIILGKIAENKSRGGGVPLTQAAAQQRPTAPDPPASVPSQLLCPNCGGSQFQANRSAGAKALLIPTVGIGALLAPKSRVKCVTCGTVFKRG